MPEPKFTLGNAINMVCKYCTTFECCRCPIRNIKEYQYDHLDDGPWDK